MSEAERRKMEELYENPCNIYPCDDRCPFYPCEILAEEDWEASLEDEDP